jgi:protein disulfide-isomerase A6
MSRLSAITSGHQESGLCSKHGVSGYPTIKYFMSGESSPKDYNGGRQLDELKKFSAV